MVPSSVSPPSYLEKEDGLTQECKDLLPSLPQHKGWVYSPLYQYQGFWLSTRTLPATLSCQKHFQAHNTDVFLVTTPKSGTTWLKAMTFAIINRFQYSYTDHPLLANNPHDLIPFLELQHYADNNASNFAELISPRLFSTHLAYISLPESVKESKCKIVYLCRNPKDTLTSLWHFANKVRPNTIGPISLEDAFEMFCKGVSPSGPIWDHVLGYWKESLATPERILFVKYEDIRTEPILHLKKLAEFLGYPFSLDEEKTGVLDDMVKLCSFDNLRNLEVNKTGEVGFGLQGNAFFRRGEIGDSVNYLTPEMMEHIDRITEDKLRGSGLQF